MYSFLICDIIKKLYIPKFWCYLENHEIVLLYSNIASSYRFYFINLRWTIKNRLWYVWIKKGILSKKFICKHVYLKNHMIWILPSGLYACCKTGSYTLHSYISWCSHDTTIVLFRWHKDVTVVAPVVRPTVLYQPVVFSTNLSITHSQDGMIKLINFITTENKNIL